MSGTDERGTVTAFVVGITIALFAVAGLVFDGGSLLAARREAANVAESAARAGVQEIDTPAARRSSGVILDAVAAKAGAENYLATAGYDGTVSVRGNSVRVDVTIRRRMFVLGVVGVSDTSVTAHGEARGARGTLREGN